MIKFFNPEDFDLINTESTGFEAKLHDQWFKMIKLICLAANTKLEREGKVVYSHQGPSTNFNEHPVWISKGWQDGDSTHKALLIDIEPIEKCTHPSEKVKHMWGKSIGCDYDEFRCECGAIVKPETFKEVK